MFRRLLNYLRTLPQRQFVRPWALMTPILVVVVTLPLLRPLRNPDPATMSSNELSRLAAVQAMSEQHHQEIESTAFYPILRLRNMRKPPDTAQLNGRYYSDKAPVLSAILSGAYTVMRWCGLSMAHNQALVIYLLTIICAVVPAAACGGMIYRMGRLFELRRPWRAMLAAAVTFGSGLVSYAVVINSHAPAAALVMGACACLVHITVAREPTRTGGWLLASGFCAALAAVIDPAALVFFAGLVVVIVALRWRKTLRLGGVILYFVGAAPILMLHATLTVPITGDLLPATFHEELQRPDLRFAARPDDATAEEDESTMPKWLGVALRPVARIARALVGDRGIFSHFPVLIIGVLGIGAVLRRHWPIATKVLAGVTLVGGCLLVIGQPLLQRDAGPAGAFGPRWFLVFLPLLAFWGGAWLRKSHHPVSWTLAGVALTYSVVVSLLGVAAPFLTTTSNQYNPVAVIHQLMHPQATDHPALASN